MHSTRRVTRRAGLAAVAVAAVAMAGTLVFTASPSGAASNCSAGYVALTFDDGPNASTTNTLLSILKNNGVRATLFNIGQNAAANPSLVQAEVNAGMWVNNHSYTHGHMTSMSSSTMTSELQRTNQVLQQNGASPKIFRPPYGETNGTLQSAASSQGLTTVTWDVDSQDWNGASTSAIVSAAGRLTNGQIILMHDQYQTTRDAIPQIVSGLNSRNLCAGMISPSTGRAVAPDGTTPTTAPVTTPPTTPPTTRPVTTPPGTTPPVSGNGCTASYAVSQTWNGGFVGSVTVKNDGTSSISGWRVTWTFAGDEKVSNAWNATVTQSGATVTATNASYNGGLGAGASVTFGFQATGSGSSNPTLSCTAS